MLKPGSKVMIRMDLSPTRVDTIKNWCMFPGKVYTFQRWDSEHKSLFCVNESPYSFHVHDVVEVTYQENLKTILK